MLLKMRGLPPKTQARSDDGVLAAIEGSDEAAIRWFDTIKISSKPPLEFTSFDKAPLFHSDLSLPTL